MTEKKRVDVFFVDLDGTSLDTKLENRSWFSETNINAIKKVRKEGKKVIISTGRNFSTMKKYIDAFGGEYAIMSNGAEIYDIKNKKLIYDHKLTLKQMIKITNFAQKHELSMRVSDEFKAFGIQSWLQRFIVKQVNLEPHSGYSFDMKIGRSKVLLWGKINSKVVEELAEELEQTIKDIVVSITDKGLIMEINHKDDTKGLAAEKVTKLLKLDMANAAHIGDTMNDATAISKVGTFIAMKNSIKKLKMISPYIGPSYKNGGVAKVILDSKYEVNKKYDAKK